MALKKLKELATDAISLPSPQEVYDRICDKLHDARRRVDACAKRQIEAEKIRNGTIDRRALAAAIAGKNAALAAVARLERESAVALAAIPAATRNGNSSAP